jgi:hypothetical protein
MSEINYQCNRNNHQDPFDRSLYRLFKIVLFIIAVWAMWRFLNEHVPVEESICRFFGC